MSVDCTFSLQLHNNQSALPGAGDRGTAQVEVTRRGVIMLWAEHNNTEGNPLKANHQPTNPNFPTPPPLISCPQATPCITRLNGKQGNCPTVELEELEKTKAERGKMEELLLSAGPETDIICSTSEQHCIKLRLLLSPCVLSWCRS